MKLIQCHIENFGKLTHFDYTFVDGLNSIKAENGWGKSTFATFIKAMFYGFSSNKRDVEENDRKKYAPWQGGKYGGNLVFEVNHKQYKIERSFGEKSKTEDTFNLIDMLSGKPSKDYGENIGVKLFGLDEDAFERSSYIPQKVLNANPNDSLTQKLTNIIQGTTADYNFEQAKARLKDQKRKLTTAQKTGQIDELESKIEVVLSEISELKVEEQRIPVIQNQIAKQENEIEKLSNEQNQIQKQINAYGKLQERQANQALLNELSRQVTVTQNEIQQRQAVLNRHQTTLAEVDSYLAADKAITARENEIRGKTNNDYALQRQQVLTAYFHGNVPTAETVQSIYNDVVTYNHLKIQTQNVATPVAVAKTRFKNRLCLGLVILALMSLLVGACVFQLQMAFAIATLVLGGVLLLASGFLYLVNMINAKTSLPLNVDYARLQSDQNEMLRLQKSILEFIHQYEQNHNYLAAINSIMANLQEYETLQAQMIQNSSQVNSLSQMLVAEKQQIANYLAQFIFDENHITDSEKLTTLRQVLIDLDVLQARLQKETRELMQFKKDKNFDASETLVDEIDINTLQQKEQDLQNLIDEQRDAKAQLMVSLNQIQNKLSVLSDKENEKINLENERDDLKRKLFAVEAASKFLQVADESLSSKFLAPMKQGLTKYLNMITGRDYDNLNLDTDLNITFEEYGKARNVGHYSTGYKNSIDLSLRFALVDVLYRQEKPFIVLDDPFVNLDDTKVKKAKQFLQNLSQEYQLIYFACHESRC